MSAVKSDTEKKNLTDLSDFPVARVSLSRLTRQV